MENGEKKLKHGEVLFEEGKSIEKAFMLKSGKLTLFVERGGKCIEVQKINAPAMVGAEAISGKAKYLTSGKAQGQLTFLEIPLEVLKAQLEKTPPVIKVLLKGQIDTLKALNTKFKSSRLDEDPNPIPQKLIPRVFSSIALTGQHVGLSLKKFREEEENAKSPFKKNNPDEGDQEVLSPFEDEHSIKISWSALKLYTTRFFMESHKKVEFALQIMSKMNFADLLYAENDEGVKELKEVYLHNLALIEEFADFYQYHLYKGGSPVIQYDPRALKIAHAIVSVSDGVESDFRGSTVLDYDQMLADLKAKHNLEFKADHINLLEQKGLFVKRQSQDKGMKFSFDREEFSNLVKYWQFLKEVYELNDKGFVDLTVEEELSAAASSESCPDCKGEITEGQNFCGQCGYKLAA